MFIMKRLLLILILTLSFKSWAKADDIRDFEIEGMSIGNSLLDKYSQSEIKKKLNDENAFYYKDNRYLDIFFKLKNTNYEWAQITIKPKDKNFIIYSIGGQIDYIGNIQKCYKDMKSIFSNIKENYKPQKIEENIMVDHTFDKTGNSKATYSRLFYHNGVVNIECYDWSNELPYTDKLLVSVMSSEFRNFINNEAYQ
jgi:hypothetical protein